MSDEQNNPSLHADHDPIIAAANLSTCPECANYLAGWKRSQADYQNLQKDLARERTEMAAFANQRLLIELLPLIDQFDLAMRHMPDAQSLPEDAQKIWSNWLTGLRAVQASWNKLAQSLGLERVRTDGMLDPLLHEALGEEAVDGKASGMIVRVVDDGWSWHGKILRPARVIVAK